MAPIPDGMTAREYADSLRGSTVTLPERPADEAHAASSLPTATEVSDSTLVWARGVLEAAGWLPPSGGSLPPGGTTGEVLTKLSNTSGDADWEPGGGSSAVVWKGPYTVTAADIDPDTGYAVVATPPTPPVILVDALVYVTDTFDDGTSLRLAVGDPNGAVLNGGSAVALDALDGSAGFVGIPWEREGNGGTGMWLITDIVTNRILFTPTGNAPTVGSADVYLCFATPTAP